MKSWAGLPESEKSDGVGAESAAAADVDVVTMASDQKDVMRTGS